MIPTCQYRKTLARDDQGADVWALQANLNAWSQTQPDELVELVEDGSFGGRTYRRVRTFQRRRSLFIDGICGPRSQRALAVELLEPRSDAHDLPHGLLMGQVELESAYYVGATNCLSEGHKDCGWTQKRIKDGSDDQTYYHAFYGPSCFETSARNLRQSKDAYYDAAAQAIKDHELMWRCAVLKHNWPAAANRLATGGFDTWTYTSDGKQYGVDDPAPWIKNIGAPGVETARQWIKFYVDAVARYCTEWTP